MYRRGPTTYRFIFRVKVNSRGQAVNCRPTIAVSTTGVDVVRCVLYFTKEVAKIVTIIYPCDCRVIYPPVRYVNSVGSCERMSTGIFNRWVTICGGFTFSRSDFRVRRGFFTFRFVYQDRVFTMPCLALVISASANLDQCVFGSIKRKGRFPILIVGINNFHAYDNSFIRSPYQVRKVCFASKIYRFVRANDEGLELMNYLRLVREG